MSKSSQRKSSGRRPSPLQDRRVWILAITVLLLIGYYGYSWWAEGADRAARRRQLLADANAELVKPQPDGDVLSRVMAGLQRLPDAGTAEEVLAVRAEIELVRGRPERALELFGSLARSPGATPAQARLGSRILLAKQQLGGGETAQANAELEQVAAMARRAYARGADPADAFRGWQASKRHFDHSGATEFAEQLASSHADSVFHELVDLADQFTPAKHREAVRKLVERFDAEHPQNRPSELVAMQVAITLASGDLAAALKAAENELLRSANVPTTRYVMAVVLHASGQASKEAVDRQGYFDRRNEQLDWLIQRAPPTDKQQARWRQLRAVK